MALALQAAAPLRRTIRSAMDSARSAAAGSDGGTPAGPYTPVQRLLRPDLVGTAFDDGRIHVQLFGMVMGFIPTNVLAAGNILDTLLSQPEQLAQAVAAADASDDERLWRCLRETLRFRNINLGPLRVCAQDLELVDASGRRKRIRAGTKVLACTQSAMFDPRSISDPHRYSIARADEDYLVFGVGQHWCIGAYIAIAQITQMFKLLLTRYRIARYRGAGGDMQRWQVFPLHMKVQLTPRSAP
jgi:cytochrome P450